MGVPVLWDSVHLPRLAGAGWTHARRIIPQVLPVGRSVLLENRVSTQRATRQTKVLIERIYLQPQVDVEWEGLNAQSQPPTSFPLSELEKIPGWGLI